MDDDSVKLPVKRLTIFDKEVMFYRSYRSISEVGGKTMGFHLMITTGIIPTPNSRYVRLFFSDGRIRRSDGMCTVYRTTFAFKMTGITPHRMIKIAKIVADIFKDIDASNAKKIKMLSVKITKT